jgi:hypothetical protein
MGRFSDIGWTRAAGAARPWSVPHMGRRPAIATFVGPWRPAKAAEPSDVTPWGDKVPFSHYTGQYQLPDSAVTVTQTEPVALSATEP